MIKNPQALVDFLVKEIKDRMDVAVVGMSGGIDSSVVTALCVKALGKWNVNGVHMPYDRYDEQSFNARSQKLADHLGVNSIPIPIKDITDTVVKTLNKVGVMPSTLSQGNTRSRSRMVLLYALAGYWNEGSQKRVRVVGTGNLSEDYIGYDTKGGDALADFFPIGELFKSEVYQLAEFLQIPEEFIDRTPSAGLWQGQTDESELGFTYNEMEPVIKSMLKGESLLAGDDPLWVKTWEFVAARALANGHKHQAPPAARIRTALGGSMEDLVD